ncbi:MAG TPA: IclR family transcriptional regulator [Bryobacteraceae bacterium]|nr:IclR family transcriptional regulator [Bryobacteraceae bacterium]
MPFLQDRYDSPWACARGQAPFHELIELREMAPPFMRHLSEAAQATANLAIFDPHELEIIFVEQIDSPTEVQIRLRIGKRVSPHTTAVGEVLFAHLDSVPAAEMLKEHGMPRITKHTITDSAQFARTLEMAKVRGYATDHEEAAEGACCIGAPVRNHKGDVVAAISISMMAARVGRQGEARLASLVKAAAADISRALGCQGKGPALQNQFVQKKAAR